MFDTMTIFFEDWDVLVEFEYEREEPKSYDHPGYPAKVTILEVAFEGLYITHLLKDEVIEKIETIVFDKLMEE